MLIQIITMHTNLPMKPSIRIVNSIANINKQLWTTNLLKIKIFRMWLLETAFAMLILIEILLGRNKICLSNFYLGLKSINSVVKSIFNWIFM